MAKIIIYTKTYCPYCDSAKKLFENMKVPFETISIENDPDLFQKLSKENGGWRTVPMIFINDKFVGGFTDVEKLQKSGELAKMLD